MTANDRLPVIILTGFLGSGKTTLLNRLLQRWPRSALIINEFGTMPIDQQLIKQQDIPMAVLSGGCLCCQIKGTLAPTLKNLWMARNQAKTPKFERVIIETSGVASPEPVLDTLLHERWLSSRYQLQGIIATLASPSAEEHLARFAEAQAQIAWADKLVLTHTDLASAEQIASLETRLEALAPATPRFRALCGDIDPDTLLTDTGLRRIPNSANLPDHGFHSLSLLLEAPIPWLRLKTSLETLLERYASVLVRVKGVVYLPEQAESVIVQGAAGRLYPPIALPTRMPDDNRGRLVFITAGNPGCLVEELMETIRGGAAIQNGAATSKNAKGA